MSAASSLKRSIGSQDLSYMASGQHGEVYKIDGTQFAVKISKSSDNFHEVEKQIYERLGTHQDLLRYYNGIEVSFPDGNQKGLVFEFHHRGKLADNLYSEGKGEIPENLRHRWTLQIARAVTHVQANNIVHGHIGCQNMLLADDNTVKLADFGGSSIDGSRYYAFAAAKCRRSSAIAPPIRPVDLVFWHPSQVEDTFALGMVVYELWIGKPLYSGWTAVEILEAHDKDVWPDLGEIKEEVIREAILGCWSGTINAGGLVAAISIARS